MPRYKLMIEYDGTKFVGWQHQTNGLGVQEVLERAVKALTGEAARPYGAGRTDAGVHALGQVAHVDFNRLWPEHTVRDGLNHHLKPFPVTILAAKRMEEDFHARFSATCRHYLYRIVNRRSPLAIDRNRAWLVRPPLNIAAMREGARHLIGCHDFTTFRSGECQAASPVKTLKALIIEHRGEEVRLTVCARSFLHKQVRSIVGTLERVGQGAWRADDIRRALDARDRSACGPVAPAHGLYLSHIDYDE
ncbi:MAG: tRNA pseudouridine(38-40) synthase TruA [Hyphomicrobiales bacterium]